MPKLLQIETAICNPLSLYITTSYAGEIFLCLKLGIGLEIHILAKEIIMLIFELRDGATFYR